MEDLSLHVMDVVENSIAGGATVVLVRVDRNSEVGLLTISIQDDGTGMTATESRRAIDPFYTTKDGKRIGLGLPLLRQAAAEAGGMMDVTSTPGEGTVVRAEFRLDHPDRKPLGDMEGTIDLLRRYHPEVAFTLESLEEGTHEPGRME